MKRINLLIISIIFTLFFFPDNVFAAESLGTCVYELDSNQLLNADFDKFAFSITVNDDGTIGEKKFSVYYGDDEWSKEAKDGLAIGNSGVILSFSSKIFDKNGDFYQAYMEKNNCPTMEVAYRPEGFQLEFKLGTNNHTHLGVRYHTFSDVKSTGGTSDTKPSETITYCNEKPFTVEGFDSKLYFTTTEINGVKEYSIKTEDGDVFSNGYDQIIALDTFMFHVNPNSYNVYWSNKCQDTPLYVAVPDNTSTNRVIQHTQDSTVENYEPPLLNDGSSDDNWDKEIGCEDIFDVDDEGSVGWILMTILNYIRVIGPIAVVLLSSLDFIKAIMSSDEKAMKQAQSKLIIRLVAALALFLIPTLVSLLLSFINATNCTLE